MDPNLLQRLIGQEPNFWRQPNAWAGFGNTRSKKAIPKWDGKNPAKTVKTWLKDFRMWRQETELPQWQHGRELQTSFESGTWMRAAAERAVPEEQTFSNEAWELILTELLTALKPYLDIEVELTIEELVYHTAKTSKESFS